MDNNLILMPIPIDTLLQSFREIVRDEILKQKQIELSEKFLSPQETCKLFMPHITIATLENYSKKGFVKKYFTGGRTWYKYSELMESLNYIRKYKRQQPEK